MKVRWCRLGAGHISLASCKSHGGSPPTSAHTCRISVSLQGALIAIRLAAEALDQSWCRAALATRPQSPSSPSRPSRLPSSGPCGRPCACTQAQMSDEE